MSTKKELMKLLEAGGKIVMQGGSRLHNHGDQPTIFLRETKQKRKETRVVTHVYDSDTEGQRVRDHVGEVWVCKPTGDGNFRAIY